MTWHSWVRGVEIEPSLYAADFANLGAQVERLLDAGVRVFHFDVGDGRFVEPVTMGPIVLQSIAPLIHGRGAFVDCHLMVVEPEKHMPQLGAAGGDSVTFHIEASDDPTRSSPVARSSAGRTSPRRTSGSATRSQPSYLPPDPLIRTAGAPA
jgi:pentose-5-phosphate-3-epimerase